MSTGMDCHFIILEEDNRTFYILESGSGTKMGDFYDYDPHVGGPFDGVDAAWAGLHRKHANPGGGWYDSMTIDELLAKKKAAALVEKALGKPILRPEPPEVPTEVGYILAGDHAMFGVASSEARFWRHPLPDAYPGARLFRPSSKSRSKETSPGP